MSHSLLLLIEFKIEFGAWTVLGFGFRNPSVIEYEQRIIKIRNKK